MDGDADWAADKMGHRSTSAGHMKLCGALVHTYSRTQATAALSSAESEVYAMGSGACEASGVKSFVEELPYDIELRVKMRSDIAAALLSQARLHLGKLRHVHLKHISLQGLVREGRLVTEKISGVENSSDLGTKYLERAIFEKHRGAVRLQRVGDVKLKDVAVVSRDCASELRRSVVGCLAVLTLLVQGAESCCLMKEVVDGYDLVQTTVAMCGALLMLCCVDSLGRHAGERATSVRTSRTALEGAS